MKRTSQSHAQAITLPLFKVFMPDTTATALQATLNSGFVAQGPRVAEFESALTPWFGSLNVLGLNCGTSALHLALHLADVGPGDEVISTPMTCVATNEPILHLGASVVWADIDPSTGNIRPDDILRKITSRTKAIMVMHWGGWPCDLAAIREIAAEHNVVVIEDACQAFGASYESMPIGSHSEFCCFSFQAVKVMTTGDGGALVCKSEQALERGRLLRWYGLDRQLGRVNAFRDQDIAEAGYKLHMNDIAATIGLEQLHHVARNLEAARSNAALFQEAFSNLHTVKIPRIDSRRVGSWWVYTLRVPDRVAFMDWMSHQRIGTSPLFRRNDHYSAFRRFATPLPGVDEFNAEHVCIPCGWWVDDNDAQRIIEAVHRFDKCPSGC